MLSSAIGICVKRGHADTMLRRGAADSSVVVSTAQSEDSGTYRAISPRFAIRMESRDLAVDAVEAARRELRAMPGALEVVTRRSEERGMVS